VNAAVIVLLIQEIGKHGGCVGTGGLMFVPNFHEYPSPGKSCCVWGSILTGLYRNNLTEYKGKAILVTGRRDLLGCEMMWEFRYRGTHILYKIGSKMAVIK
jgi:hypothetical protein